MSAVTQQEDIADSNKDDENNILTPALSENPGNSSGDAANTHLDDINPKILNTVEHPSSTKNDTEDVPKPMSPEKLSVDLSEEKRSNKTNKSPGESELTKQSSILMSETFAFNTLEKDIVQAEAAKDALADKDLQSVANSSDTLTDIRNLNLPPVADTGYKETVIDDPSDSEIELRWSDDEGDDEINAVPLSDEALKSLDIELGIADADITENSKEDAKTMMSVQSVIDIEKSKELVEDKNLATVTVAQQSIEIEKATEIVDNNSSKDDNTPTIEQGCMEIENLIATDKDTPETVKTVSDAGLNIGQELNRNNNEKADIINNDTQTNQNSVQESYPIKELINPVESVLYSLDTESKVGSNLEPPNPIVIEAEKPMDVDISPVGSGLSVPDTNTITSDETESATLSLNSEKLTHLVKEMDVEKEDKISEIDIDETIVDLKHLIDQDEDTIKQLGLDVGKSDNPKDKKHEQTYKPMENKNELNEIESDPKEINPEIVKVVSESAKIDSDINDISVNKDDTQSKEDDLSDIKSNSLKVDSKSAKIDSDTTNKSVVNDKHIQSTEDISTEVENGENTKDDSMKISEEKSDIQYEIGMKVETKEFENDKREEKFTAVIDKGDSKNKNQLAEEAQTVQKLPENDATKELEKLVSKNIDEHKLDKSPIETEQDIEEFITPDVTNDSIKINTEHRINRPDVMLDIPTQEFDFDDFEDNSEMPGQSDKTDKNGSDLTTKTVTEIVNQLAKNTEIMETDEIENQNLNTTTTNLDIEMNENIEVKIIQDEKSKKTATNDTKITSLKNISEITDTVDEDIINSDSITEITPATLKSDIKPTEIAEKSLEKVASSEKDPKSTLKVEKPELDVQPSTSQQVTRTTADEIQVSQDDNKTSELKSIETVRKPENIDPQPSTSEGITDEVTDSLGLLAESSRVMVDDDEEEPEPEEEAEDGDAEDDDYDPDEEGSSNPTAEHSEESNPPHSEVDMQEDGIDIEFNNEVDKIGLDSNDTTFDTLLGDSTDITIEENEPIAPVKALKETLKAQKVTSPKESTEKKETESSGSGAKPKQRRSSILAELLTKPAADMNAVSPEYAKIMDTLKKTDVSKLISDTGVVVDLGESSSEDDAQVDKDSKKETPSVAQNAELDVEKDAAIKPDGECVKELNEATKKSKGKDKLKAGEVYDLDSDDDELEDKRDISLFGFRDNNLCINYKCTSDESVAYYLADRMTIAYYGAAKRRKRAVCQNCLNVVNARNEGLVSGIKDLRPLMSLRMARPTHTLLEISDSDSEGEGEPVGEEDARYLEDKLPDMMNEVWKKYNMDERLIDTIDYVDAELEVLQKESEELDTLLRDCQKATDELRVNFYSTFEGPRHELPGISIHDTPIASYACLATDEDMNEASKFTVRYPKRRSSTAIETPAKKLAHDDNQVARSSGMHEEQLDDRDISVVRLSAEAAPDDLPPPGELVKPPLRVGLQVYAMKNQYGAWLRGKVLEIQPKTNEAQFTTCRIRFEHKVKNPCKMLSARSIAYVEPSEVRMTIGTRVIALFKNSENTHKRGEFYYSGVIAEIPNPVNAYRYLVFFDDGYAQYVEHRHTRLVYESKTLVWEEVHPFSRDFVCNYLMKYPERPMVRMHAGQEVNVEWNGKWWDTQVIRVDAALVHVRFPDSRTEWIYRGSTRLKPLFAELLAAKRGDRARLPRSTKANTRTNVPYVEYTRSDDQAKTETQSAEDLRRQRSVAKKSTTIAQQISNAATDGVISRVVFYTPKNSVRPLKMVPHTCGPQCKRSDLLTLKDLRTYNPLTKPLLSGWERQIVRHKSYRDVMYRAPCGRRVRNERELHAYLRAVRSDMPVDLFDFNPNTHCLAEFVLNKTNVQKKDLSHGKEIVPVPCVNYYDHSLPEFCSYNTERTPTAGVPLNLDPEFLCGCDCDDDCADKTKCACWKMTLEGAKTIGMEGAGIGYEYRRLPEPLPSGIYECNSRCKCKSTCLNRVVQNPLQLKLQVFKTLNRGWGIRALNDVPKGAFICIYAGNLLTDATANLDGLNEGDEYLAELDYIEVVESMKEGYEEDIPEPDKALDKKESKKSESEPESESSESEEESQDKSDIQDGDFQPGYLGFGLTEFNKRLRRRDKKRKEDGENKDQSEERTAKKEEGDECITISDDEEVRVSQREPSRFAAQESMTDNKAVSKYRSIRSYFGEDEACYIMDAKVQGNIGRYLNHSCSPNVFVQNVFVDTHDPRFPWVSFFALHHIRAGTELTWNYNYDIGSVPGKVLYCYCGAPNCRGRLL